MLKYHNMCEKANFIVEGLKLDLYVSYLYSKKVIIKNIKKFGGTKIEKKTRRKLKQG